MRVQNELVVGCALAVGHFVHPWTSRDRLVILMRPTPPEGNDVDDELLIPPPAPGDVSIQAIAQKGGVALERPVVAAQRRPDVVRHRGMAGVEHRQTRAQRRVGSVPATQIERRRP